MHRELCKSVFFRIFMVSGSFIPRLKKRLRLTILFYLSAKNDSYANSIQARPALPPAPRPLFVAESQSPLGIAHPLCGLFWRSGLVFGLSLIPVVIGILFWGYHQYLYSIEREFGRTFGGLVQSRLLLNMLALVIMVSPSFALPFIIDHRMEQLITPHELKEDVKMLNTGVLFFPTERDLSREKPTFYNMLECAENNYRPDCASQYSNLMGRFYANIRCHDESCSQGRHSVRASFENNQEIMDFAYMPDKEALLLIAHFDRLFAKYGQDLEASPERVLENWKNRSHLYLVKFDQQIDNIESRVSTITYSHKQLSKGMIPAIFGVVFCVIFGLASTANMMKSFSVKELLLSFATLAGLFIAGVLMMGLINGLQIMDDDSFFFLYVSAIYAITALVTYRMAYQREYSLFKAINLMLNNLFTPGLIYWNIALLKEMGFLYVRFDMDTVLLLLISGILFYSVALVPIYQRRLKLLRALPKR